MRRPKSKGCAMANHGVAGTWRKLAWPAKAARRGATHQPQQYAEIGDHAAAEALDGYDQRYRGQPQGEMAKLPKSAAEASPPPSQPPATGNSDRADHGDHGADHHGGKKRSMRLNQGPTRMVNNPQLITAP